MTQQNEQILSGGILSALAAAAVPLLLGDILQQLYNTIDAFIIGRYMGSEAFAAVGVDSTVMNLFLFILVGFCSGISMIFAAACGAGDAETFRKEVRLTALHGGVIVAVFSLLAFFLTSPLLRLLQTPESVFGYAQTYLRIVTLGLPASYYYNLGAALLRAIGRFRESVLFLGISVVLNLFGDWLLVAVFPFGIAGAACATVAAQLISAAACFAFVRKRHGELLSAKKESAKQNPKRRNFTEPDCAGQEFTESYILISFTKGRTAIVELRVSRNCHAQYNLEYHLILCTKYGKKCITEEMFEFLKDETVRLFGMNDIILEEIGYEADHVHFLISAPPQVCLSSVINSYKSVTSRLIRKRYADYLEKYYWKPYFWSRTYLILSSGSAPAEVIKRYLQEQGKEQDG